MLFMIQTKEKLPKPCRILRALGKCTREPSCAFPIGKNGCFTAFEREESESGRGGTLVSLLDFTLELHDEVGDGGKKVPVYDRRTW